MRISLALVVVLASTSAALAVPSLSWDKVHHGGGVYGYSFQVDGNDGQQLSFHVDLTFTGANGGVIQQMQVNLGGDPIDVHEEDDADIFDTLGAPPYDKLVDSYLLNPFNFGDLAAVEGSNSYYLPSGSGGGSTYESAPVAHIVCSGGATADVAFTGVISRDGVNYAADGETIPGDANWNQAVNLQDLILLANDWQGSATTWGEGDFNGDRATNLQDLMLLAGNWQVGGSGAAMVPGPTGLFLLIPGAVLLLRRRR